MRRVEKTKRSGGAEETKDWIGLLKTICMRRQNTHLFRELDSWRPPSSHCHLLCLPNSYGSYWGEVLKMGEELIVLHVYTHTHTQPHTSLQHARDSIRNPVSLTIFLSVSKFCHRQTFSGIEEKIKFYQGFEKSLVTSGAVCFL